MNSRGSDGYVPLLCKLPGKAARIIALPPPPDHPPPPVPTEKSYDGSTCSVISDDSPTCASDPSERLDASCSDGGELDWCTSVEIDFDSLVFELGPEDVSGSPSAIRTNPIDYDDEVNPELQLLPGPATLAVQDGLACEVFGSRGGSTPLSSNAKAWTPGANPSGASMGFIMVAVPAVPTSNCAQMWDILVSVQTAMAGHKFALDGGIYQCSQGWAITMYLHPAKFAYKEQLIDLGKTTLIENSKRSRSIYIVGYCNRPCVSTSDGFQAVLCDVENCRDACWNFIKDGFCRHHKWCSWQHPDQPVIDVMVKIKPD